MRAQFFIDSTHIKASANKHKRKTVTVTKPIKDYQAELENEINEQRLLEGKKNFLFDTTEKVEKKISTTDSDCGLFVKGEHERCFAYSSQTACDMSWILRLLREMFTTAEGL